MEVRYYEPAVLCLIFLFHWKSGLAGYGPGETVCGEMPGKRGTHVSKSYMLLPAHLTQKITILSAHLRSNESKNS